MLLYLQTRVTRDEVKEKNKQNPLNGGFEVLNCHSTKTALCNNAGVCCMYIFDMYLIDYMPAGE